MQDEYEEELTQELEHSDPQENDDTQVTLHAEQSMQQDLDAAIISGVKGLSLEQQSSEEKIV